MPPGLLRVEGLTRRFGKRVAVDHVSFDLSGGEVLGLLGPNGAGKTTTLLSLCGLLRPDAGKIAYNGALLGPDRGRIIGLIPETPEVYPMLTVWEHLEFVARAMRLGPQWQTVATALLESFGLEAERNSLGEALSKGMCQKTLIAATVLADTPVLLLDEPLVGLDPKGQRELSELIGKLRKEGRGLIISTHLMESAESLCDRVLILKHGVAVAEGSVSELRARIGGGRSLQDVFLEITA